MKKTYYKVVRAFKYLDSRHNAIESATFVGNTIVRYKIGEWVSAPGNTRLFVFENLKEANVFASFREACEIYECQIVGGIRGRGCYYSSNQVIFWKNIETLLEKKKKVNFDEISFTIRLLNSEAILAKKVKLIKKII